MFTSRLQTIVGVGLLWIQWKFQHMCIFLTKPMLQLCFYFVNQKNRTLWNKQKQCRIYKIKNVSSYLGTTFGPFNIYEELIDINAKLKLIYTPAAEYVFISSWNIFTQRLRVNVGYISLNLSNTVTIHKKFRIYYTHIES